MDNLNYVFFDEYARLEQLCCDIYQTQQGVSHYIDHMKQAGGYTAHTASWNADLQQLIRLRHIRNHFAHTPGAFLEEACDQSDIDWLVNFHNRILNRTDPLAELHKRSVANKTTYRTPNITAYHKAESRPRVPQFGCLIAAIILTVIIVILSGLLTR